MKSLQRRPVVRQVPAAASATSRRRARAAMFQRLRTQASTGRRSWKRGELYESGTRCDDNHGTEFNPMPSLKALTYFEDGDVRNLGAAVRKRLELAVTKLRIDGLEPFAAENSVFDAQAPRTRDIHQAQET